MFYAATNGNEHENWHDNDSKRSSMTSNSCGGDNDRNEVLLDESSRYNKSTMRTGGICQCKFMHMRTTT